MTKFHKKVFPAFWFGFLAISVTATVLAGAVAEDSIFLVVPIALSVFGFALMRKMVWDLVDEVYDCGDYLLVKNKGEEEMIALSNVMNVCASTLTSPPRVALRLVHPGKFGSEIAFSPITNWTLNPFAKNQIADDLIVRVDRARRAH